jgi:exonuclease III
MTMTGSLTDKLTIASFNCKYFDDSNGGHKMYFMNDIFNNSDFICLQEHWLLDTQFHRFDRLSSENVDYVATSAMDSTVFRNGRPHGGTAIIWRKSLKYNVTYVDTYSKRLSAVKIQLNDHASILLFTVYMPVDDRTDGANLLMFQDVLSEISAIRQKEMSMNVIIVGDFNTDFVRTSHQTSELRNFSNSEGLHICTEGDGIEYTFENLSGNRSKIDHCLVSKNLVETRNSVVVSTYDSIDNSSDHICLKARFNIDCEYIASAPCTRQESVSWYKASVGDIDKYKAWCKFLCISGEAKLL